MRLSLPLLWACVFLVLHSALRTPHSALGEIFARWQFSRLGEHPLPLEFGEGPYSGHQWQIVADGSEGSYALRADFSGVIAGPRVPNCWTCMPTAAVFNAHTGELFDLGADTGILDVTGTQVLINRDQHYIFDAADGSLAEAHHVDEPGELTGIERAIIPYNLTGPARIVPHPVPVTNGSGQLAHALALDDAGRVLVLRRLEDLVVDVPNDVPVHYPQFELALGQPVHIAGDYDASGGVNQADLDVVLLNWGAGSRPAAWVHDTALFAQTGQVDQSALDGVLLRWGATDGVVATALTGQGSVPEPHAIAIALVLLVPIARYLAPRLNLH
jgi:hypothetical protein